MPNVVAHITGTVFRLEKSAGDSVSPGDTVVILESMKMESGIASPCDGRVEKILVQPGAAVETDDALVTFSS